MMFRRTSNGLSNQHLFHNADLIVFVEGGKAYSVEEAYQGKFSDDSIDIKFWSSLFSFFYKGKKIKFRAVGSKETLINIAHDIDCGNIKNVYVAMDRDFDSINNKLIRAKGVFYTHGYSWENDVWHPEIVQDVFNSLCSRDSESQSISRQLLSLYDKFSKEIGFAVCTDAFLHVNKPETFFIPRKKHLSFLMIQDGSPPSVNVQLVEDNFCKCSMKKKEVEKFGERLGINTRRDCYGHLLSDFCYFLISHFLTKICKYPSVAKQYVNRVGIDKYFLRLINNDFPVLSSYYQECFLAI